MNTLELIERLPISEQLRSALLPAIAKAGPMKGHLLSDAPADNTAWQILIGYVAPARLKITGLMFGNATTYRDLDELCRSTGINWAKAVSATEPYARWNCENINRDAVLAELEPHLLPAKAKATKKRAHACVEFLDRTADVIASGQRGLLKLEEFKDDKGNAKIAVRLLWEGTRMKVVMDDNVDAVRARADRLDRQIRTHKAKGESKGYKEARRNYNWKVSMKVVPLSPERAAECGMEVIA